jgi:exodeoxyribonuclease VII large subunit
LNHTPQASTHPIYSVSKLTREIKHLLEDKYDIIWISGEISNIRIPSSGHAYFTLKDECAQIAAVMFKGQLGQVKFDLEDGVTIVGMGRVSVYEPRGSYQIILEYIEPRGIGALQIAFEQLKRKLGDEGLFDPIHKKRLPFLPDRIAIVTSPTGAVIHDMLHILYRRFPNMRIDIYPVRVQGDASAGEISKAVNRANARADADVIVLARGGGSMEDLATYNSEVVARSIFASDIPVVSAIGHETDYTIADFVADLRAPTPSAAAELLVPVKSELVVRQDEIRQRCYRAVENIIVSRRQRCDELTRRLVHPRKHIQELQMRIDELSQRLVVNTRRLLKWQNQRYLNIAKLLAKLNPYGYISNSKSKLDILNFKMSESIKKLLMINRQQLSSYHAALHALSPVAVLKRGYSITRTLPRGTIVTTASQASVNQPLEIILSKGSLDVTVTACNKNSPFENQSEE